MSSTLQLIALAGLPMVRADDDIAELIAGALTQAQLALRDGDVVVVAQKIVSKAEGRTVDLATVEPSAEAVELAREVGKDPRLVEVVLRESARVVRSRPNLIIVQHRLGFVMANAGVDQSNVAPADGVHRALLLPRDPDAIAPRRPCRVVGSATARPSLSSSATVSACLASRHMRHRDRRGGPAQPDRSAWPT